MDFASARASLITQLRIIDQEAIPGVPPSSLGFGVDMLNLVFPLHVDRALSGRRDFENLRAGSELWLKLFGTGLGGAAVLVTAGLRLPVLSPPGQGPAPWPRGAAPGLGQAVTARRLGFAAVALRVGGQFASGQ